MHICKEKKIANLKSLGKLSKYEKYVFTEEAVFDLKAIRKLVFGPINNLQLEDKVRVLW